MAEGGSLFLDEIGEMPLLLQTRLLSVLEKEVVRRVGGRSFRPVDVRLIAAEGIRSLEEMEQEAIVRAIARTGGTSARRGRTMRPWTGAGSTPS